MGMTDAIRTCFSKYATFSGRASRPEFWWFLLAYGICMAIAFAIDVMAFGQTVVAVEGDASAGVATAEATHRHRPLEMLVWLVFFLPLLAAAWRRMQDTGRPGVTILIPFFISLAAGVFLFLGVLGFSLLEMIGLDGQMLRVMAASLGLTGIVVSAALFVTMRVLILWWLTRPGETSANAFGLQPAR